MQLRTLPAKDFPDDKAETSHSQETPSSGESVTHLYVEPMTHMLEPLIMSSSGMYSCADVCALLIRAKMHVDSINRSSRFT